jgi:glycosyltransferase involved in cell wall biosynthesis
MSALRALPRGKTGSQDQAVEKLLPTVHNLPSLQQALAAAGEYDGKLPDERADERLRSIDWVNEPTLVFVGRLIAWKGIQSLIAALPFVLREHPKMKTIVVGHGPLREAMEAMVWALRHGRRDIVELIVANGRALDGSADPNSGDRALSNIQRLYAGLERRGELDDYFATAARVLTRDSVIFTGYLTHAELRHLFPCCDVGVFPSIVRESGPMVFLEALASGCFPLGTYFGGMAASIDAVREGVSPQVSEIMKLDRDDTVSYLAEKIPVAIRVSDRYRQALGSFARENYDWSSVAKIFLNAIDSLMLQHSS